MNTNHTSVVVGLRAGGRVRELRLEKPPAWTVGALCAQTDPEAFFPEKGGTTRFAKRICAGCPVRVQCLDYAMETRERFGVWGGLSERERRALRHQQEGRTAA
jgi:WhiB family redox-sensing transcriptional regulator